MHHNDAPNLDPRTDITDLFVFQKPSDPAKSILILNVNPEAPTHASTFDPRASYELKIDTNGDFEAEIAFHVLFTNIDASQQAAALFRATDAAARAIGPVGEPLVQRAPVSFTQEARITTEGRTGSSPVFGASRSSLTRSGSRTTCNGQLTIMGRARTYLESWWSCQTMRSVLTHKSGYGRGRWHPRRAH